MISPEEAREMLLALGIIVGIILSITGMVKLGKYINKRFPRFSRIVSKVVLITFTTIMILTYVLLFGIITLRACELI